MCEKKGIFTRKPIHENNFSEDFNYLQKFKSFLQKDQRLVDRVYEIFISDSNT